MSSKPIVIEISPGELFDKITILVVKTERIKDKEKLNNVRRELELLDCARRNAVEDSTKLQSLVSELKGVNTELYDVIDAIYRCMRVEDFGGTFVNLSRSVYRLNDHRATVKRTINLLLHSSLVEEKGHRLSD